MVLRTQELPSRQQDPIINLKIPLNNFVIYKLLLAKSTMENPKNHGAETSIPNLETPGCKND